jgi:hypothetical protein
MYSPDAVVECACGGCKIIHGQEGLAAYWRHHFIEMPALELEKLRRDAAECELIRDLATDPKKRELFDRLAAHLMVLASEVERAMLESGKRG